MHVVFMDCEKMAVTHILICLGCLEVHAHSSSSSAYLCILLLFHSWDDCKFLFVWGVQMFMLILLLHCMGCMPMAVLALITGCKSGMIFLLLCRTWLLIILRFAHQSAYGFSLRYYHLHFYYCV